MEAWKDELYHYGTKGMKWKKRKLTKEEKEARKRQQKMNKKVSDIERKARLLENARKASSEASYEAEYGRHKNKHDQRIADKNANTAQTRLRKVRNANAKQVTEHSKELRRVITNRRNAKKIGRMFVRKKTKIADYAKNRVKKKSGGSIKKYADKG
jgi:hypothetical protein